MGDGRLGVIKSENGMTGLRGRGGTQASGLMRLSSPPPEPAGRMPALPVAAVAFFQHPSAA